MTQAPRREASDWESGRREGPREGALPSVFQSKQVSARIPVLGEERRKDGERQQGGGKGGPGSERGRSRGLRGAAGGGRGAGRARETMPRRKNKSMGR